MEMQALKKDIFMKLGPEMLFRFRLEMENFLQELGLGPGFISTSTLILILTE